MLSAGKIDFVEPEPEEHQAVQMTRDDNVLLNDVYFTSYNMNHHQPLTPLTPISKIVSEVSRTPLTYELWATLSTQIYPHCAARAAN